MILLRIRCVWTLPTVTARCWLPGYVYLPIYHWQHTRIADPIGSPVLAPLLPFTVVGRTITSTTIAGAFVWTVSLWTPRCWTPRTRCPTLRPGGVPDLLVTDGAFTAWRVAV